MAYVSCCFVLLLGVAATVGNRDPVANPDSLVISACARFTVLTSRLVRLEYSKSGDFLRQRFDDRATFAVVNRRLPTPPYKVERANGTLTLSTSVLRLTHRPSSMTARCNGQRFAEGEIVMELLVEPFTTWRSGNTADLPPHRRSSVAHIVDTGGNLNGTMNYGPSFSGGLDCYSSPPDCAQRYRQVIGKGLLSRSGFVIVNDTNDTRMDPNSHRTHFAWFDPASTREKNHRVSEDLYLLVSGVDYKAALGDWARMSGPPSLPPLAALGVWYSHYYPYDEVSYKSQIVENYRKHDLPLSVGVLDLDWHNTNYATWDLGPDKNSTWPYPNIPGTAIRGHECNGWDGFTFNHTLWPNPKRFFDEMHGHGLKMILSVHMQDGIDHCQAQYVNMSRAMGFSEADIKANTTVKCAMDDPKYVGNFFTEIVDAPPLVNTSDWWWLDYPGGASKISDWDPQEPASLWWSNHMFAEHARASNNRPVILARYGGLGAQRDGLGFSGDSFEEYSALEFEIEMTPVASNVLFGWWSHDIGGNHNGATTGYDKHGHAVGPYPGDEDPQNITGSEMLLRWIQFGVFSPIFRTHCQTSCNRYVWEFPHFTEMRAAMRLRDALVPYIYSAGFEAYRTGVSLLRPMYYEWPRAEDAYSYTGQYMFGSDILVAPLSEKPSSDGKTFKKIWIPPMNAQHGSGQSWMHWNGSVLTGVSENAISAKWALDEIPMFVRPGSIIPMRTMASTYSTFSDPQVWATWVQARGSGSTVLYEDQGEGLEYTSHSRKAAFTHAETSMDSDATHLVVSILASRGSFAGQGVARNHLVQFRGIRRAPAEVRVNGRKAPRIQLGSGQSGWYLAGGNNDQRNSLTEPPGVLVVSTGRVSVRSAVNIEVKLVASEYVN